MGLFQRGVFLKILLESLCHRNLHLPGEGVTAQDHAVCSLLARPGRAAPRTQQWPPEQAALPPPTTRFQRTHWLRAQPALNSADQEVLGWVR